MPRNPTDAWLLWMFFGWLGLHRYYIGDRKMGIAMTLTLGGLGLWSLLDGFFLTRRLRRINSGHAVRAEVYGSSITGEPRLNG